MYAEQLADFIEKHAKLFVLTGAGISTDSGIPDYRDRNGDWKISAPMQHREFMESPARRQRYWARSLLGWPVFSQAQPNSAHIALERMRKAGLIELIVTQNVDRLHQKAGSEDTIDLHGRGDQVRCMSCDLLVERLQMYEWCRAANPWVMQHSAELRPDGDADLEIDFSRFRVPDCPECGGIIKTDVVYFGDNVPKQRVIDATEALQRSSGLLAVGTSLMVYSGFRFNRYAQQLELPQAALTLGKTRADEMLTLKLDTEIGPTLERACELLGV